MISGQRIIYFELQLKTADFLIIIVKNAVFKTKDDRLLFLQVQTEIWTFGHPVTYCTVQQYQTCYITLNRFEVIVYVDWPYTLYK